MVINGLTWELKMSDNIGDNLLGLTEFNEPKILIKNQENKENLSRTLLHEIVHAYLYSYGLAPTKDKVLTEEELCDFIANNLHNIKKLHNDALIELGLGDLVWN